MELDWSLVGKGKWSRRNEEKNKRGYESGNNTSRNYSIHIYEKCHKNSLFCTVNVLIKYQKYFSSAIRRKFP